TINRLRAGQLGDLARKRMDAAAGDRNDLVALVGRLNDKRAAPAIRAAGNLDCLIGLDHVFLPRSGLKLDALTPRHDGGDAFCKHAFEKDHHETHDGVPDGNIDMIAGWNGPLLLKFEKGNQHAAPDKIFAWID